MWSALTGDFAISGAGLETLRKLGERFSSGKVIKAFSRKGLGKAKRGHFRNLHTRPGKWYILTRRAIFLFSELNKSAGSYSFYSGVNEYESILINDIDIDYCARFALEVGVHIHISHRRLIKR